MGKGEELCEPVLMVASLLCAGSAAGEREEQERRGGRQGAGSVVWQCDGALV